MPKSEEEDTGMVKEAKLIGYLTDKYYSAEISLIEEPTAENLIKYHQARSRLQFVVEESSTHVMQVVMHAKMEVDEADKRKKKDKEGGT